MFIEAHQGRQFTYECLALSLQSQHTCWMYKPRVEKGLLPYSSRHTKLVKKGIAQGCIRQALNRSCFHKVRQSVFSQFERLEKAGYHKPLLIAVAEKLMRREGGRGNYDRPGVGEDRRKLVVLPYVHGFTHRVKKVAAKHGVYVVCSSPFKLKGLCRLVNSDRTARKEVPGCGIRHKNQFVQCQSDVVYHIPLTCGKAYVGQSGRCVNTRLREHNYAWSKQPSSGHLAIHCRVCKCEPLFNETGILNTGRDRHTREVIEAYHILRLGGERCVSEPSIGLCSREFDMLHAWFAGGGHGPSHGSAGRVRGRL